MHSLRDKICQSPSGHYSDEHTFIFSWTKITLVFIFLNRFLLCAECFHNTVTKIATFANFMYQAGFYFFLSAKLPWCCWWLPHNLFLLSGDKSPSRGEREHMGAVVDSAQRRTKLLLRGRRVDECSSHMSQHTGLSPRRAGIASPCGFYQQFFFLFVFFYK